MFTCFQFVPGSKFAIQLIEDARALSACVTPEAGEEGSSVQVMRALACGYINTDKSFQFIVQIAEGIVGKVSTRSHFMRFNVTYVTDTETVIVSTKAYSMSAYDDLTSYFWRENGFFSTQLTVTIDDTGYNFPHRAIVMAAISE